MMHPIVHGAIHETLNSQFRSAGITHPEPLSEALEYFCLDDQPRARGYIADAYRDNAPEQLIAVARVLRRVAPMLGSYAARVMPFLDFLAAEPAAPSRVARAEPAQSSSGDPPRRQASTDNGTTRCVSNLGQSGESCTGSPECGGGLGCIDLHCRARALGADAPAARDTVASTPASAEPPLDATPSREEVRVVLGSLPERVSTCTPGLEGVVPVTLTVISEGSVAEAHVQGPLGGTPAGTCVEHAVMDLHFPRFTNPRLVVVWNIQLNRATAHPAAGPHAGGAPVDPVAIERSANVPGAGHLLPAPQELAQPAGIRRRRRAAPVVGN